LSEDNPTLSEIGEQNIRDYQQRKGENIFGEPVDYLQNYLDNKYERGE
jgi:hypothetical protein